MVPVLRFTPYQKAKCFERFSILNVCPIKRIETDFGEILLNYKGWVLLISKNLSGTFDFSFFFTLIF